MTINLSMLGKLLLGGGAMVMAMTLDTGVQPGNNLVSQAQARVGRPATPVSVAGVARRTTRRTVAVASTAVVVGHYYPALPSGCITSIRGSVTYYHCGSYWYQPVYSGPSVQYIVITSP